ncbi:hypothetical protein PGT21_022165 [Puccinia graminis f. sp. tritici]|uniref:Uncharacterized protein n=1 Tax=Puccinia graminis f. sp. tritici TaxID=56615 RepID=A0A5B0P5X5_PUCGR|nr:hypothetical protein PGTUg99_028604 [Puccinia graminis f. sp. tritici]KAA1099725.1 hypothetical protein PGT21_018604 [Puccinia graminis f. sp. tritici]KAA1117749.1 hypothetical protein PGT21_022165 [Puccinia graminis f. sp. tritici]
MVIRPACQRNWSHRGDEQIVTDRTHLSEILYRPPLNLLCRLDDHVRKYLVGQSNLGSLRKSAAGSCQAYVKVTLQLGQSCIEYVAGSGLRKAPRHSQTEGQGLSTRVDTCLFLCEPPGGAWRKAGRTKPAELLLGAPIRPAGHCQQYGALRLLPAVTCPKS